jgi:asparagine synthase (glutamine-hydrolysing)
LKKMPDCIAKLDARGPEGIKTVVIHGVGNLGFTRLAINGLNSSGMQPMIQDDRTWVCNGEIYNWRELAVQHGIEVESGSDCEVIGKLYEIFMKQCIPLEGLFRALDGVFAIVIVDEGRQQTIVARDPYGVRPLYVGQLNSGEVAFASELKALPEQESAYPFPPGHYMIVPHVGRRDLATTAYHTIPWLKNPAYKELDAAAAAIRTALVAAVKKRMMTERPVAALLSGGLDSSLVAALVAKELRQAGAPPLRTFSVGMKGSSDLFYARKVADWIGSKHTEVLLTADDFFQAVPEVIRCIESYDTTTVRASVGNWLVAKAVKEQSDCKVVFNGDGADEVWGSYLYFYSAPSDHAFEEESARLLQDIHMFDVLRSDRSISSHGLEPRTPYLDKEFVAVARSVSTALRRPTKTVCEKWLMRHAFEAFDGGLLPPDVLWRRKEAFSDGVSGTEKAWYEIAQEKAAALNPKWMDQNTLDMPKTAEQYYYRKCFLDFYGEKLRHVNVPYFWMPRWSPGATDPSARVLKVYSGSSSDVSASL